MATQQQYEKVEYPASTIYGSREFINWSFAHKSTDIRISCRVLEQGFSDRRAAEHKIHPQPDFSRLFIFTSGSADITTENGKFTMRPGTVYHLPPGLTFSSDYEISKLIFFHLHITDITGQTIFANTGKIEALENKSLYQRFNDAYISQNKMAAFSAIMETLAILIRPGLDRIADKAERSKHFSLLFEYIDTHQIAKITISELAELYNKTPDSLSKSFHRSMGISLKHFLLESLLTQAKELLVYSTKTVSDIADELGFSSSQYFHRFFKKHCQCTPNDYRYR